MKNKNLNYFLGFIKLATIIWLINVIQSKSLKKIWKTVKMIRIIDRIVLKYQQILEIIIKNKKQRRR